ncbi:putative ankyrin repeat protein RF_0381 [Parasteatoda tepidariorum]|uniref:putative ankyrin repeat protein RF_0381 n=1 Tax=Parasteatoda tepidariorum TaxID=114398 RepID=UPI00077FCD08|nr:putative ankyrin repeat protein RF_0381 [Parasteatoda tepidariorum]
MADNRAVQHFHDAVKANDLCKVEELLKEGVSPDEPTWNNNGRPAILQATYQGNLEMIELLLKFGSDPNAKNMLGETALHNAFNTKTFSLKIVSALLEHGASVNIRETLNGYTPIHLASKMMSSRLNKDVQDDLLLALKTMCIKADISVRSSRQETPLHRLVLGNSDHYESLQVLIDNGYEINAQNERGESVLMCAISKCHVRQTETLIRNGANVNIKDRHFQTALHHCAQKNLLGVVRLLLDAQCNVNALDLNGDTALHIASSKGLTDMVRILVNFPETDVTIQNIRGSTPILNAVESGFTQVVELLLDAYCDADSEKGLLLALDKAEENFSRCWHPEIFSMLQDALEHKRDLWDEGETSL